MQLNSNTENIVRKWFRVNSSKTMLSKTDIVFVINDKTRVKQLQANKHQLNQSFGNVTAIRSRLQS